MARRCDRPACQRARRRRLRVRRGRPPGVARPDARRGPGTVGRALPSPRAAPHRATRVVARRPSGRGARAVPRWRGTGRATVESTVAEPAKPRRPRRPRKPATGRGAHPRSHAGDANRRVPSTATDAAGSGERPSVELQEDVAAAGTMILEESLVVEEAVDVVVEGDVVVEESIVLEEPEVGRAQPAARAELPAPGPGLQRRGSHRRSPSPVPPQRHRAPASRVSRLITTVRG